MKFQIIAAKLTPILLLLPRLLSVAVVTVAVCFADTNVASALLSNVDGTNTASQSSAGNLQMLSYTVYLLIDLVLVIQFILLEIVICHIFSEI